MFLSSDDKFWFDCLTCGHTYDQSLSGKSKGKGCRFCARRELCSEPDCKFCFDNSFASHEDSKYWSEKNSVVPRAVPVSSNNKFWFDCPACGHTYDQALNKKTNEGKGCRYCAHRELCSESNCKFCFNNSFASCEKSVFWSKNNELTPRQVFKSCDSKKYYFNCDICEQEFLTLPYTVNLGHWCNNCHNKTEKMVSDFLTYMKYKFIHQYRVEWCKDKNKLAFDFYFPDYNVILEIDGRQHFEQVLNWADSEFSIQRDVHKMKCAIANGITVCRLLQEEIWKDKFDWKEELKKCLKLYDTPRVLIFGIKKELYNRHLELFADPNFNFNGDVDIKVVPTEPKRIYIDLSKL